MAAWSRGAGMPDLTPGYAYVQEVIYSFFCGAEKVYGCKVLYDRP